jgi:hypothetical protein
MNTRSPLKAALCGAIFSSVTFSNPAEAANSAFETVDQGPGWTATARVEFYSQNQGSRIMPLSWLKALRQANGQPFLADSLSRYGYLANPDSVNGLPVGFTAAGLQGAEFAGITCSACHTRQIEADGKKYRIDGGPAITDLQSFFADLDVAVARVLESDTAFQAFAAQVLGPNAPQPEDVTALRKTLQAWYLRYHTLMTRALPEPPWGVGRADAAAMIFNRITGLDIGLTPNRLIEKNIKKADAPVRYPFLWNAPRQDKTQWAGFAANGNDRLAMSRNLGEVYGVFGEFAPAKDPSQFLGVNYLNNNSADFDGLNKLESLVKRIGPPKWPWPTDASLAKQGKAIYERTTENGGCKECHGISPGQVQSPDFETWATPVRDVGTDSKQYEVLNWMANTGVLEGAEISVVTPPLPPLHATDCAFGVLKASVLGSIVQNSTPLPTTPKELHADLVKKVPPPLQDLKGAVRSQEDPKILGECAGQATPETGKYRYEARVMEGIWAAAPYLHNGSVPTLAELLKPPSERVSSFQVGPAYDKVNVGLAANQPKFGYTLTTGCGNRNWGDSNCGHDYGTTQLKPEEKKALLEYLKTL